MPTNTNNNVKFVRVNGSSDLVNLRGKTDAYKNAVNAVEGVQVEAADANGDVYVKYNDKYMTKLEFTKIVRPGAIVHACDNKTNNSQYYDMDNLYIDGCKITDTYNTLEPKIRASRKNGRDVGCLGKEEYNLEDLRNMSLGNILDIIFFPKPKVSQYVVDWTDVVRDYWFLYHDNGSTTGAPTTPGESNRPDVDLTNLKIVEHFEDGRGFFIDAEGQSASIEGENYNYDINNINTIHQQRTLVNYDGPQSRDVNVSRDTILDKEYKIEVKVLDGDNVSEPITSETASDVFPMKENISLKLGVFISTRPLGSTNEGDWVSVPDNMIVGKTCDINLYKNVYDVTLTSPEKTTYIERDPLVISDDCKYTVRFTDGSSVENKLFTGTDHENGSGNGELKIKKNGTNGQVWNGSLMKAATSSDVYNAFDNGWSLSDGNTRKNKGMHKTTSTNPNTLKVTASYRHKSNGTSDEAIASVQLYVNALSIDYVVMTSSSAKTAFIRHDNFDLDVYYSPYANAGAGQYYGPFGVTIHYKADDKSIDSEYNDDKVTRTYKTDIVYYGDSNGIGGTAKNDNVDGNTTGTYPTDVPSEANTSAAFTMFSDASYANSMTITDIKSGYNLSGITNTLVDTADGKSKTLKLEGDIYFRFNAYAIRSLTYTGNIPVLYFDEISASASNTALNVQNNAKSDYKFHYTVNEHQFDRISFNNYTKTDYLIADDCDILTKTGTNGKNGDLKVYGQLDGDNPGCAADVADVTQSSLNNGNLGSGKKGYVLLTDSKKTNEYGVAQAGSGNYILNYVVSTTNLSPIISAGTDQTGTTTGTNLNKFSSANVVHARFWNTKTNYLLATSDSSYETSTTNESKITYAFKNGPLKCVGCEFKAVSTAFVGLIPYNAQINGNNVGSTTLPSDNIIDFIKANMTNAQSSATHSGTTWTYVEPSDAFCANPGTYGYFRKVSTSTDMCVQKDSPHNLGYEIGVNGKWTNSSDYHIVAICIPKSSIPQDGMYPSTSTTFKTSGNSVVYGYNGGLASKLKSQSITNLDSTDDVKYDFYIQNGASANWNSIKDYHISL